MKVVFLDFDGVLIPESSCGSDEGTRIPADPGCVQALNYIIEATGAGIVVISAWRIDSKPEAIRRILDQWGVRGRCLGCTPDLWNPHHCVSRGSEIQRWVDKHQALGIEAFVILDDIDDMDDLVDRLVQTNFDTGLTMADAKRAIAILLEGTK